jgi:hypothetical protein
VIDSSLSHHTNKYGHTPLNLVISMDPEHQAKHVSGLSNGFVVSFYVQTPQNKGN